MESHVAAAGTSAGEHAPLRQHRVTCSLDCPDTCRVIATEDVNSGRLVKLAGDSTHPITRGFLCGKVARYLDRLHADDRVLYPMRRRAGTPKGQLPRGREHEAFERVTWDTALAEIARRFTQIAIEHGPESILPWSYAGTTGALGYGSMDRRFFHRLGGSQLDRTICASAGGAAFSDVYGVRLGTEPQSFVKSRFIVAWGANIHGNNIHLWPFIEQARRDGARLVVIDPYETRTARLADVHLRVRPGTDVLLAMSLMHVILRDGLESRAYIDRCTHGFEDLRRRVLTPVYSPASAAAVTGIDAEAIEDLARAYATAYPAVIRLNYGVQRSESGGTAVRAISMLPLLTGAWQHAGGGLLLSTSGAFAFNKQRLEMPELAAASPIGRAARTVNMSRLGHALNELGRSGDDAPPVHALFVYNGNPAAVAPNQRAVLQGLRRADLFTVVHDVAFTDTADYADILLPAPTWLEQSDVQGAYGHYHVQLSEAAIAPLGESRSNVRVFGELAQRMGFSEPCFRETEDDLIRQALDTEDLWLAGASVEALRKAGGYLPLQLPRTPAGDYLPFSTADWFRTPTGRGEFASSRRAAAGLDPLPAYVPGEEGVEADTNGFPLQMLPRKADNFMNSTFAMLPKHRAMEAARLGVLEIHPADAAPRQIADGDRVDVRSARGSVRLTATLSSRIAPGVCGATLAANKLSPGQDGVNVLTSERLTDIGEAATFYSTRVEVTKIA